MESPEARAASFKKSKRVKNPTKSSSTTTLKWPHPPGFKANPANLAEAGFYYDPSYEDPDNVTCYMCKKELSGWEEDDDPFLIHMVKCGQTCGWASARCGLIFDLDKSGRFISSDKARLPSHKFMEKARLETFSAGKGWIHDRTPNHVASSINMARAGFVFTPQHTDDDLATCFYCSLSLSGWDPKDDPLEEHRKRANKGAIPCAFFATSSIDAVPNKPTSRTQSNKPASKSQSKPSSRSTSRSKYQDTVVPIKTSDDELDGEDGRGESSAKPAKLAAKTPRKGRSTSASSTKKSTAKTPGSKVRSSSRTGLKNVVEEMEHEDEGKVVSVEQQPPEAKKSRSRSKSVARPELVEDNGNEREEEPSKPTRSRSKKTLSETEETIPPKPSRTKSKSKSSVATSLDEAAEPLVTKHSRTKSKARNNEPEQDDLPLTTVKPKHKRAASRSRSKAPVQVSEAESDSDRESEVITAAPKKASSKPKPPQTPAAENLFDDDVFVDHASPTKPFPTVELPPLFVPKRNTTKQSDSLPEDEVAVTPAEKQKRKPGRPKSKPVSVSRPKTPETREIEFPESTDASNVKIPAPTGLSAAPSAREKSSGKSKAVSQNREEPRKQRKVVEISSDDEPEENIAATTSKEDSDRSHNIRAQTPLSQPVSPAKPPSQPEREGAFDEPVVQIVQLPAAARTPSPPIPADDNPGDVSMAYEEANGDIRMEDAQPKTPPRQPAQVSPADKQAERRVTPPAEEQFNTAEPLYVPALSKIPFTPLHALTEAELDMTVEEWIRYQMEVEYDKFRRDGERELQRFRTRAEEVRKVIEGL